MKKLIAILFLILSTGAWAGGWSGADIWADSDYSGKIRESGGFLRGYVDTITDKLLWEESDRKAWSFVTLQLGSAGEIVEAVDTFYKDPSNKDVSTTKALRICLERLIAKTPDGPRLLAAIGVDVKKLR
jgi:hypothetical protein